MKPEMIHSIRWRLVASYVLLTLLTVTVVGLLASEIVRRNLQQQEFRELQANARAMAQQMLPLLWVKTPPQQMHSLAQAASFLGDVRVRIFDRENQVLTDSGIPGVNEELLLIYPPEGSEQFPFQNEMWFNLIMPVIDESLAINIGELQMFNNLPSGTSFQVVERITGPWGGRLTFGMPVSRDDNRPQLAHREDLQASSRSTIVVKEPIGDLNAPLGFVELSAGQDYGSAALAANRRAFILAGAGAVLLAVIVGLVISQRLTSPLRKLQNTANQMGSGDLSARAPIQRKDEIGDLAAQFNHMADQLQQSFSQLENERDTLRRFISDASHELRTPVTALKNFLSLIQGSAAADPEAQVEFLSESQIQVERLEWITSNLLDLSRMDAGLFELNFAQHDLGELIKSVSATFSPIAIEKKIALTIREPEDPISLWCDAARIELVLTNLLDNAFKFTPPGGQVLIGFEQLEQIIRIWIQDNGIGINAHDLPHIFERFYRGHRQTEAGSGLGLAITKSYIEAHGGSIQVESTIGEGTQVNMEFPITK
jgi:signal transduction histidine kinase